MKIQWLRQAGSHRERWMMMIANTKAAFAVEPRVESCSIFVFQWNVFSSWQKSRACAEVNNVQDEWQRTVETKSTFLKSAHTHSSEHSHRERFPGGQKVRSGFTSTSKLMECGVLLHHKWNDKFLRMENYFHLIFRSPRKCRHKTGAEKFRGYDYLSRRVKAHLNQATLFISGFHQNRLRSWKRTNIYLHKFSRSRSFN